MQLPISPPTADNPTTHKMTVGPATLFERSVEAPAHALLPRYRDRSLDTGQRGRAYGQI